MHIERENQNKMENGNQKYNLFFFFFFNKTILEV